MLTPHSRLDTHIHHPSASKICPALKEVAIASQNGCAEILCESAIKRGEAHFAQGGAMVTQTTPHTGRSPHDKFIVEEAGSRDNIGWGSVNRPLTEAHFDRLQAKITDYLKGQSVFVQDCYCGADPDWRLPIRVITQTAWHNLFARNMFIQPSENEFATFAPRFTLIHAPGCQADPSLHGTHSDVFIAIHLTKGLILIGGTAYAGEIKKAIFSVMNYLLPEQGILPMHCAANQGINKDTAIFFGLSGTGKTTLSTDPNRPLIGDDEHGWGPNGIFNFEGGCYAKVIRLSPTYEPDIYATTNRFGTILENVVMNEETRIIDFDDARLTENTRASYPLEFIPNASKTGMAGHPKAIIMLTADAFGVLPPLARLTPEQAMYHFLSGYTARVAGTEKGVGNTPQATFSACFGAPFMPRHPTIYAKLLATYIKKHQATCWLVNTGWSGGAYGVGQRVEIAHTRAMISAALNGELDSVKTTPHAYFGVAIPDDCPHIPAEILEPQTAWKHQTAYDEAARHLTRLFAENFAQYEDYVEDSVKDQAIRPL